MTYRFVGQTMNRVEKQYMELTEYNTNKKINSLFDISYVNIYIEQRVEDYQMNRLTISTFRSRSYPMNLHLLKNIFCEDISNKIIQYNGKHDKIKMVIDIHYDPLEYPFRHGPIWNLCTLELFGLEDGLYNGLKYLVVEHNEANYRDWSPSISLRTDLVYFISKFCKLLKYI